MTRAVAPGKVIISGEHAVVYGQPALAAALGIFSKCEVESCEVKSLSAQSVPLKIRLPQFNLEKNTSTAEIGVRHQELCSRYANFQQGRIGIREVLEGPMDLIEFCLGEVLASFNEVPKKGLQLTVSSDVPMGCGLGSSASVVMATIVALLRQLDIPTSNERIFEIAQRIENLQHGKSSGVDLFVSQNGGAVCYRKSINGAAAQFEILEIDFLRATLVNTGVAESSTGQSVSAVASRFADSEIWNSFGVVTAQIKRAIKQRNVALLRTLISDNQRLLCEIGVVPKRVQQFIVELEQLGMVGKVTGAGSVAGDRAGMLLVIGEGSVGDLCEKFGYSSFGIEFEANGVH